MPPSSSTDGPSTARVGFGGRRRSHVRSSSSNRHDGEAEASSGDTTDTTTPLRLGPLLLSPLYRLPPSQDHEGGRSAADGGGGPSPSFRVVQRIVTPYDPCSGSVVVGEGGVAGDGGDGELEASVEEEVVCHRSGDDAGTTRRRVAIRYGYGCGDAGVMPPCKTYALPPPSEGGGGSSSLPPSGGGSDEDEDEVEDPILCWASFRGRCGGAHGGRPMLCVLASPSLLRIFDVLDHPSSTPSSTPSSPSSFEDGREDDPEDVGPEGHVVPLPFEACAIHANPHGGVLLQRSATADDHQSWRQHRQRQLELGSTEGWGEAAAASADGESMHIDTTGVDGGGGAIQPPPAPVRLGGALGGVAAAASPALGGGQLPPEGGVAVHSSGVPSLFSLRHPLDEIRPVSLVPPPSPSSSSGPTAQHRPTQSQPQQQPQRQQPSDHLSDAFEKLVFVGTPDDVVTGDSGYVKGLRGGGSLRRRMPLSPVCVTYHSNLKRHAVWLLHEAPPPPPTPALWQTVAERGGGAAAEAAADASLLDPDASSSFRGPLLVDVAGGGGGGGVDGAASFASSVVPPGAGAVLSPAAADDSAAEAAGPDRESLGQGVAAPAVVADGLGSSPLTHLHPDVALAPLWTEGGGGEEVGQPSAMEEEEEEGQGHHDGGSSSYNHHSSGRGRARTIFLSSDLTGSLLVLCALRRCGGVHRGDVGDCGMVDPVDPTPPPHHVLQLLSIDVDRSSANNSESSRGTTPGCDGKGEGTGRIITGVSHLAHVPCLAAVPVRATDGHSVDVMVLCHGGRGDDEGGDPNARHALRLHRADVPIVDCALPPDVLPWGEDSGGGRGFAETKKSSSRVIDLCNPVGNRFDLSCISFPPPPPDVPSSSQAPGSTPGRFTVHASLSLVSFSSPVTESALTAIGAATKRTDISLHLRADCARLVQVLPSTCSGVLDPAWTALCTVMEILLADEASSSSPAEAGRGGTTASGRGEDDDDGLDIGSDATNYDGDDVDEDDDPAWDFLLNSEFHRVYADDNADLFGCDEFTLHPEEGDDDPIEGTNTRSKSNRPRVTSDTNGKMGRGSKHRLRVVHLGLDVGRDVVGLVSSPEKVQHALPAIFDALHLLYEDCKVGNSGQEGSRFSHPLGSLLTSIALRLQKSMGDFLDHYHRDLGSKFDDILGEISGRPFAVPHHGGDRKEERRCTTFLRPPCVLSYIEDLFSASMSDGDMAAAEATTAAGEGSGFPINDSCVATRKILRFVSILFDPDNTDPGMILGAEGGARGNVIGGIGSSPGRKFDRGDAVRERGRNRDRRLVLAMVDEGFRDHLEIQDYFRPSLALPLMEALNRCRNDPPIPSAGGWPPSAFVLIGRQDIASMARAADGRSSPSSTVKPSSVMRGKRDSSDNHSADDGLQSMESYSSMLFPHDKRIREACRILRSSRPCFLRVARAVEVTDHDFERVKQAKLLLLCRRTLALPLGRGMLTFGTLRPVMAEPLPIPDLCLAGRVPPNNATLALDVSTCPADMTVWPEFHNGVAAGLRVEFGTAYGSEGGRKEGMSQITRTWIVYNKPTGGSGGNNLGRSTNAQQAGSGNASDTANHAHGGLLMALGLRGYLSSLAMTDIYEYLTQGTVTTTVGVLLGMAANRRSSCDPAVSKMLCLHIPSLLPPSFSSMEVAPAAQAAAVAGIGLLYQGSSHRLMTEFLLNEMGRRPMTDQFTHDREGYTLACGLALGMVNLGTGERDGAAGGDGTPGGSAGLADLRIEERLHRYIVGGRDDAESRTRREAAERASSAGGNAGEPERCSRIFEGDLINTDVTAPGATLALGLMFLRSGNKSVASRVNLPDTHFLLDYVRPDLLMLRVISRSLILWDDVKPTSEWINHQIPCVLKKSYDELKDIAVSSTAFTISEIRLSDDTVAPGRQEHKSNVSQEEKPFDKRSGIVGHFGEGANFDRNAVRQAYAYVVSGACFSLGLRFAGTGNAAAASAIAEKVAEFRKLRDDNDPISLALKPEVQILEMCLASASLALGMVMAGTGDLFTMRLLRELRWRCDEEVRYGSHMAYGAAIGLLFLGGGACTLGREPQDVAALLMAFFPRFPVSTSDHQYHLQALRHLYSLAVKHRELEAIDVETREPVYVPVEVNFTDENRETMRLTAPCLLPNEGTISQLRVSSDRYYPVTIDFQSEDDRSPTMPTDSQLSLYVKKKSGHLSYVQDPHALRSLIVQTGGSNGGSALELIESFTEDPKLLAFAEFFCNRAIGRKTSATSTNSRSRGSMILGTRIEDFCTEILYECLTEEKPEAVPLYLALRSCALSVEGVAVDVRDVWDIHLVKSYYAGLCPSDGSRIVNPAFVALLCEHVDLCFESKGLSGATVRSYFENPGEWEEPSNADGLMGPFLVWYEVPRPFGEYGVSIRADPSCFA